MSSLTFRTDLIQGAVEELLRNRSELLTPLKIWYIAAVSDAPVVFYFTRQDAARREGGGKIERPINMLSSINSSVLKVLA